MAQPNYTTDLTDVTTTDDNTNWSELDGRSSGGADATETTQFIQGEACVSQTTGVATAQTTGLEFDYGSDITAFTDNTDVFLFWLNWLAPVAIATWENSGIRVAIGSSSGNVNFWKAVGSDFGRNPYGGWQNVAIDPTFTPDGTDGTPTASNYTIFGSNPNILSAVSKGNPHSVDKIRWGRAELIIEHGDVTNGYGTFTGLGNASSANDVSFTADTTNTDATLTNIAAAEVSVLYPGAPLSGTGIPATTYVKYIVSTTSVEMTNAATATNVAEAITSQPFNSWGLLQVEGTGYLWKGLMSFGNVSNSCDFRDSNANVTIDDCPRAYALFNKIEINNAGSRVDWTNVNFTTLNESSLSVGSFEMTADATVNLTNCVFTGMSTFIFDSNATVDTCTFRRCGQVTMAGGDFSYSTVEASTVVADDGAIYCDTVYTDTNLDDMTFSKGTNAHHAIDFGTAVTASLTLRNVDFSGFGSGDDSNDSTVRFLAPSGSLTLSLVDCTVDGSAAAPGNFSIDSSGIDVTLSISPVTTTIHVNDNNGNDLQYARVFLEAKDNSGDLPFEETVTSITRSGTDATVIHTGHGLVDNEYVNIQGITDKVEDNWGAHKITLDVVTPDDKYKYTTTDSGSTSYTGTIKVTGATIHGETNVTGDISSARTYGANQPVVGYVRKSSSSPRFKTFPIDDEVDSSIGLSISVQLILDE